MGLQNTLFGTFLKMIEFEEYERRDYANEKRREERAKQEFDEAPALKNNTYDDNDEKEWTPKPKKHDEKPKRKYTRRAEKQYMRIRDTRSEEEIKKPRKELQREVIFFRHVADRQYEEIQRLQKKLARAEKEITELQELVPKLE